MAEYGSGRGWGLGTRRLSAVRGVSVTRGTTMIVPMLIRSLEGSAREIDVIFARAGTELGEGLGLFESLKERLTVLSSELGGSEIAQAGAALSGLAGELRAIQGALSDETTTLQELSVLSHAASQALENLLGHMRLITILARSARIEAVNVNASGRDFGDFTAEIVRLTTQAQSTIQNCARDHQRFAALLATALTAQRAFESGYGHALSLLADNLQQTLADVAIRQSRGSVLTADAATHSGRIAGAAGGAIIALQSGDSIRQRLEHAIAALRLVSALEAGTGPAAGLGEGERGSAAHVLHRLQSAQLRESAVTLGEDATAIEAALSMLADDTGSLIESVRNLYSGEGASRSFLADLEADLARASELLGKCDNARAGVDRVTATLASVLETCQQTVSALAGTVSSIVLIGMNAGLRAARVGTEGRSLVVIAQELKSAAGRVAGEATRLSPTFAQMQTASARLTGSGRLDAAHFGALDITMQDSLAAMRNTGNRLGAALDQLRREGGGFCTVVARATLSFSNAGAMSDLIAAAAAELDHACRDGALPSPDAAEPVRHLIQEHIWPSYTMAAERTIHRAVLTECGLAQAEAAGRAQPEPAEALDDFVF